MRAHTVTQATSTRESMRKPLVAAIMAAVGLGAAVTVAKERINVKTLVTLHVTRGGENPGDPTRSFSGKVKAKKKGCEKGRTVVLYSQMSLMGPYGPVVGSDRSNARGKFKIVEHHHARSEHGRYARGTARYRVVVEKRKNTKNSGNRIVCKTGEAILENPLPVGTWPGDPGYER